MKLRDYFQQISKDRLDDAAKLRIYEAILKKQTPQRRSLIGRFSPLAKVAVFGVFTLLMLFGQFQAEILYAPSDARDPSATVSADQVGRIVNAHGEFFIVKDGKKVTSDTIKDGDKIVLGYSSEMIFQINNSTTAKIIGPAEIVIKDVGETNGTKNYVLNLLDGTYFEMNTAATSNTNVVLKTNDTDIQSANIGQQTHFTITQSNGKKVINNKWSELLVQKTLKQKKVTTTIKVNQVAMLTSPQEEVAAITANLQNKEITKTFDLGVEAQTLLATNSLKTWATQSGELASTTSSFLIESKKVLSTTQLDGIKQYLSPTFVIAQYKQIAVAYLNWEQADTESAIQILLIRINQTSESLWLETLPEAPGNLATLSASVKKLLSQIDQKYYVSPSLASSLKTLNTRIVMLQSKEFGSKIEDPATLTNVLSLLGITNTASFTIK